ncbi:uncharacterized protein JN550_001315 [Neoarthrinium moseri]|uniref:uncharacterized protein n=1 Tax=Neoarthrinium moseri TaxID=1658444 RepID=UPI001FDE3FBA|nr:uncharacterized protein JN550_001315 [Neoarthrinium moseri]KAI1877243.1 hypothetical protein JN550_001315 [Neoarthrinium moseri]
MEVGSDPSPSPGGRLCGGGIGDDDRLGERWDVPVAHHILFFGGVWQRGALWRSARTQASRQGRPPEASDAIGRVLGGKLPVTHGWCQWVGGASGWCRWVVPAAGGASGVQALPRWFPASQLALAPIFNPRSLRYASASPATACCFLSVYHRSHATPSPDDESIFRTLPCASLTSSFRTPAEVFRAAR